MNGPSTRARLGEISGLSRPTVSTALAELTERGLLAARSGDSAQGAGRPAQLVRLSRRAGLAVGIDIGRRHVQVVLADLGYQEIDKYLPRLMPTVTRPARARIPIGFLTRPLSFSGPYWTATAQGLAKWRASA